MKYFTNESELFLFRYLKIKIKYIKIKVDSFGLHIMHLKNYFCEIYSQFKKLCLFK